MSLLHDFLQAAESCVDRAERASSEADRDYLLKMATFWLGLAEQAELDPGLLTGRARPAQPLLM
jgi:hypothetical protein